MNAKRVAWLVGLAICVSSAASWPAAAAEQPSPKVKAVLDELQRNPSPPALNDALKRAGLTKPELQELATELKNPRYAAALRLLRQKAETAPHAGPPPQPVSRALGLEALRQTLRQEHAALLARLQSQAVLQAPVRAPALARRANPALISRMAAFTGARARPAESPVHLERTDPEPAVTDVWLVIFGHDLGRQGEVTIIVGAEDPRAENAFDCRISGWGSEAIHVMVPVEIEEMHRAHPFPNGQRSALVWVKPQGDPSGRWREITVKLNPDHFVPQIESVSPAVLTPGLRFAVRGRNLSAGARPRLTLAPQPTGTPRDLQVLGYDSDWVEAVVPEDLDGYRAGRAHLKASNGLAWGQPYTVDFTPAEEVLEFISDPLRAECWSVIGTLSEAIGWFPVEGLCMMGEERRETPFEAIAHDGPRITRLSNGWTVVGAVASEFSREGHGAGCYIEHQPAAGSTAFAATELVAWANGFCRISCQATLTIRGPRGVPIGQ